MKSNGAYHGKEHLLMHQVVYHMKISMAFFDRNYHRERIVNENVLLLNLGEKRILYDSYKDFSRFRKNLTKSDEIA